MARRFAPLIALALALSFSSSATADVSPDPPKLEAKTKATRNGKAVRPFTARPAVVGLLAALFLIIGGAAGANDKKTPA